MSKIRLDPNDERPFDDDTDDDEGKGKRKAKAKKDEHPAD